MKNKPFKIFERIGLDGFILLLIASIVLAYFFPNVGSKDSAIPFSIISQIGVALIFFFYGLTLSKKQLISDIANWKLHLITQSGTFFLYPVLVYTCYLLFSGLFSKELWTGLLFLSCLPSTVSSAVVMVSIAKGNISAAIFNSSISMLIGLFLTPLWMGFFNNASSGGMDFSGIFFKLFLQIILPLITGMLLYSKAGKTISHYKTAVKRYDQSIILLIIYTSFCDAFKNNLFSDYSFLFIISIILFLLLIFFANFRFIGFLSNRLHFNREDRITAMICSSNKSLVHGTVIAKILFAGNLSLGIYLLPLMMFHPMQLFIVSYFANKKAKETPTDNSNSPN
jgi:sodium/bile acid cotransporter 7